MARRKQIPEAVQRYGDLYMHHAREKAIAWRARRAYVLSAEEFDEFHVARTEAIRYFYALRREAGAEWQLATEQLQGQPPPAWDGHPDFLNQIGKSMVVKLPHLEVRFVSLLIGGGLEMRITSEGHRFIYERSEGEESEDV